MSISIINKNQNIIISKISQYFVNQKYKMSNNNPSLVITDIEINDINEDIIYLNFSDKIYSHENIYNISINKFHNKNIEIKNNLIILSPFIYNKPYEYKHKFKNILYTKNYYNLFNKNIINLQGNFNITEKNIVKSLGKKIIKPIIVNNINKYNIFIIKDFSLFLKYIFEGYNVLYYGNNILLEQYFPLFIVNNENISEKIKIFDNENIKEYKLQYLSHLYNFFDICNLLPIILNNL